MEKDYTEEIKILVKKRLAAIPPNVSFSIGKFGDFTRDQLIDEVDNETSIGKAAIEFQLNFIRKMVTLSNYDNDSHRS
ncbi:hypothetical protein HYY74_06855 [Candidatus Woesearchaeota archaeon]|nr:hypothetical protein [Candidatus Woesearchaeota archaeon]